MSLTSLSRSYLVKLGRRLQVPSLIRQARVTHDLASADDPVAQRAGAAFLAELKSATDRLEALLSDKDVALVVARSARTRQDDAVHRAVQWRREFTQLAKVAILRGIKMPRAAAVAGKATSPKKVEADLLRLVAIGHEHRSALASCGVTSDLLAQGKALAAEVRAADIEQEMLFRAKRSAAVRRMWETAARVYLAVRQVNAYGRAVHADDRVAARAYNMDLLKGASPHAASKPPAPPPSGVSVA